jgi:hypothetical protein
MKKVLLIASVIGLAMASCKKDYTCTCKDQTTPPDPDIKYTYTKVKKKDAQKSCDDQNTAAQVIDYKCTLN